MARGGGTRSGLRRLARRVSEALAGIAVDAGFGLLRLLGPRRGPATGAAVARALGPLLPVHRVALANIAAAFPERDAAWHRATARAAWDNLGRTACEYVHLDALWDPEGGRVVVDPDTAARFERLRVDGKPALLFAAHLANWELPAVAAARQGLEAAVLYRTPNNRAVAARILALRSDSMGLLVPAGLMAPTRLVSALEAGRHVGMLVDQRFGRGPVVPFLGRPAASNPLLAHLARRFPAESCPVHGARAIRRPDGRIALELTEAIALPLDAAGRVDVAGATAAINRVVEGWVREHPGQWLWMHRRWR